jgi:UDP-N-acetyl-D-galactosamine dehydrogenase
MFDLKKVKIGIIGLGYVGLPLAVEFGRQFPTIGIDINGVRIKELKGGHDSSLEVDAEALEQAKQLTFTDQAEDLQCCNIYVITVPTPVDQHHQPDLSPLINANRMVGKLLAAGDIVIIESTVYPGATEEVCIPILEQTSGLKYNQDFFASYSPERVNPGDKEQQVLNTIKVTSGSTPEVANFVDSLYQKIVTAGTHPVSSIQVAEAAKVIENTQRDVNIALINELAILFNRLGIDTQEVLDAAGSKWNFLPFRPGLVGGHCIGVDPYYLTHKAQAIGHHPEIILAGRRINDEMGAYITGQVVKLMIQRNIPVGGSKVLILGLSFKENCPDLRNTKVVDIVTELQSYGAETEVHDPWVDGQEAQNEYGIAPIQTLEKGRYDAVILAVAHQQFKSLRAADLRELCKPNAVIYDVKSILPATEVDGRL